VSKPSCPLGSDAASATAAFQTLTRPLIDKPAPAGTRTLSYTDAITGVSLAGYSKALWPTLRTALSGLAGWDGAGLLAMADRYFGLASTDAFMIVSCQDGDRIPDRAAAADVAERWRKAAPYMDSGRGAVAAMDVCALFPVPPTSTPHHPKFDGLPPILVVSTTGDPATPYRVGVDLAKAMKGTLLTVEGNQHTAMFISDSARINAIGIAYLVDLTVPSEGARCTL
jgi:hypothetical protein